jgi:hypothetical protein
MCTHDIYHNAVPEMSQPRWWRTFLLASLRECIVLFYPDAGREVRKRSNNYALKTRVTDSDKV